METRLYFIFLKISELFGTSSEIVGTSSKIFGGPFIKYRIGPSEKSWHFQDKNFRPFAQKKLACITSLQSLTHVPVNLL